MKVIIAYCEKCNRGIIINSYREYIDEYLKCEKCGNTRNIKFNCNLNLSSVKRYEGYLIEEV